MEHIVVMDSGLTIRSIRRCLAAAWVYEEFYNISMGMLMSEFYINEAYSDIVREELLKNLKQSHIVDHISDTTLRSFVQLGISSIVKPYHKDVILSLLTRGEFDIDMFNLPRLRRSSIVNSTLDHVLEMTIANLIATYGGRFVYDNDLVDRYYVGNSTDHDLVRYHLSFLAKNRAGCLIESYIDFITHMSEQIGLLFSRYDHEKLIDIDFIDHTFYVCIKERL